MELRFLGQIYSASNNKIETETSVQKGHFLRQSYHIRCPIKISKSQLGLRRYRGVDYNA